MWSSASLVVQVEVKSRKVVVTGKNGKLEKSFKHAAVDIKVVKDKGVKKVVIEMWFGSYQSKPVVKTVAAVIKNMIDGVTRVHRYKMRVVFAHFPISLSSINGGKVVEIHNFVGKQEDEQ
jgi:large subunit ribosomal protein L9e